MLHDPENVFGYIVLYKAAHDGNSPSTQEIMRACGISSTSVCRYVLGKLEKAGRIKIVDVKRGIEVVGGRWKLG